MLSDQKDFLRLFIYNVKITDAAVISMIKPSIPYFALKLRETKLMITNQMKNERNFLILIAFSLMINNNLIIPKNKTSTRMANIIFAYIVGENL
jgi:hypothetical protein